MGKAILNVFLKLIVNITSLILTPINALVSNLVPDVSDLIGSFNETLLVLGGRAFQYIGSFIPPIVEKCIVIYLGFLITYYTVSITAHGILKLFKIIRNIKIW